MRTERASNAPKAANLAYSPEEFLVGRVATCQHRVDIDRPATTEH